MPLYTEKDITIALNALVNSKYKSICKAAIAFQIPSSTLHDQQKQSKSRTESYVNVTVGEPAHFTEVSFINPAFSSAVSLPSLCLRIPKKT